MIYLGSQDPKIAQGIPDLVNSARRRLLDQSSNLAAAPVNAGPTKPIISLPITLSSGAFPAVPAAKKQNQSPTPPLSGAGSPPDTSNQGQPSQSSAGAQTSQEHSAKGASSNLWTYIIIAFAVVLVFVAMVIFILWRKRAAKAICPFKTGISGQLQKAFVTGNILIIG